MLLFGLRNRRVVRKVVGKIVGNNTSDVTVGELENCGDSKCEDLSGKSWCFCAAMRSMRVK